MKGGIPAERPKGDQFTIFSSLVPSINERLKRAWHVLDADDLVESGRPGSG